MFSQSKRHHRKAPHNPVRKFSNVFNACAADYWRARVAARAPLCHSFIAKVEKKAKKIGKGARVLARREQGVMQHSIQTGATRSSLGRFVLSLANEKPALGSRLLKLNTLFRWYGARLSLCQFTSQYRTGRARHRQQ